MKNVVLIFLLPFVVNFTKYALYNKTVIWQTTLPPQLSVWFMGVP